LHELKGVGKNLQDHLDYITCYLSKEIDLFGITPNGVVKLVRSMFNGAGTEPAFSRRPVRKAEPS
jgi:hypothetical protein